MLGEDPRRKVDDIEEAAIDSSSSPPEPATVVASPASHTTTPSRLEDGHEMRYTSAATAAAPSILTQQPALSHPPRSRKAPPFEKSTNKDENAPVIDAAGSPTVNIMTPMSPVPLAAVPSEPEHTPLEVTVALVGAFGGGIASAISVNMGARLTPYTGHPVRSTLILYIVSISVMFSAVVAMKGWRKIRWDVIKNEMKMWQVPLPGLLGSSSIGAAVILIPYIEYATFAVCVIVGQLITSLFLDHFGLMKIPIARISVPRIASVGLISAGAVCVEGFSPEGNGSVSKVVLVALCLVSGGVGIMPPLQAGLNKLMAYRYGSPFNAALMSFTFGTLNLATISLFLPFFVGNIDWDLIFQAKWYLYSGGFFGGSYVFTTCICPKYLGASLYFVAVVSGQLLTSIVIDVLFPTAEKEVSTLRMFGICCVLVGVLALHFVKKKEAEEALVQKYAHVSSPPVMSPVVGEEELRGDDDKQTLRNRGGSSQQYNKERSSHLQFPPCDPTTTTAVKK